jgi:hypothetical protein
MSTHITTALHTATDPLRQHFLQRPVNQIRLKLEVEFYVTIEETEKTSSKCVFDRKEVVCQSFCLRP